MSNLHLVCLDSQQLDLPPEVVMLIKRKTQFSQMLFPALYAGAFNHISLLKEVDFFQMLIYRPEMQELETRIQIKTGKLILSAPTIHLWITQRAHLTNLIENASCLVIQI